MDLNLRVWVNPWAGKGGFGDGVGFGDVDGGGGLLGSVGVCSVGGDGEREEGGVER